MKITDVTPILTQEMGSPTLFVKVSTDEGIIGYGEATIHFFCRPVAGMIEELRPDDGGER